MAKKKIKNSKKPIKLKTKPIIVNDNMRANAKIKELKKENDSLKQSNDSLKQIIDVKAKIDPK